jgi:hypothetical protein
VLTCPTNQGGREVILESNDHVGTQEIEEYGIPQEESEENEDSEDNQQEASLRISNRQA